MPAQRELEHRWTEVFARDVSFPFLVQMEGAFYFNDEIFKNQIWGGFGFQKLWSGIPLVPEINIYHKSKTYSFK